MDNIVAAGGIFQQMNPRVAGGFFKRLIKD